jgi:hypothetical protein
MTQSGPMSIKRKITERHVKFGFDMPTTATPTVVQSRAAEMDIDKSVSFAEFDAFVQTKATTPVQAHRLVFEATESPPPPPAQLSPSPSGPQDDCVAMECDDVEDERSRPLLQQEHQQRRRTVLEDIIAAIRAGDVASIDPALQCNVKTVQWLQKHMGTNLDDFKQRNDDVLRFETAQIFMINCLARLLMPSRCADTHRNATQRGGNDAMKFATVCALHVSVRVEEELFGKVVNRLRQTLTPDKETRSLLPQSRVFALTGGAPLFRVELVTQDFKKKICCDMSLRPITEETYTKFTFYRSADMITCSDATIKRATDVNIPGGKSDAADFALISRLMSECNVKSPYACVRVSTHNRALVELFIAAQDIEAYVTLALQVWLNKQTLHRDENGFANEAEIKNFCEDTAFHAELHLRMKRILQGITEYADVAAAVLLGQKSVSKRDHAPEATITVAESQVTKKSKRN